MQVAETGGYVEEDGDLIEQREGRVCAQAQVQIGVHVFHHHYHIERVLPAIHTDELKDVGMTQFALDDALFKKTLAYTSFGIVGFNASQ